MAVALLGVFIVFHEICVRCLYLRVGINRKINTALKPNSFYSVCPMTNVRLQNSGTLNRHSLTNIMITHVVYYIFINVWHLIYTLLQKQ